MEEVVEAAANRAEASSRHYRWRARLEQNGGGTHEEVRPGGQGRTREGDGETEWLGKDAERR